MRDDCKVVRSVFIARLEIGDSLPVIMDKGRRALLTSGKMFQKIRGRMLSGVPTIGIEGGRLILCRVRQVNWWQMRWEPYRPLPDEDGKCFTNVRFLDPYKVR